MANEIYQRSENIFEGRNENAIFSAKMELYEKLLIVKGFKVKKFTSFEDITSSLKVAGIEIDSNIGTFDIVEMKKYINDDISTEDAILYQIEVLKAFEHYKSITNQMNNHSNVLNVDKTGAGQSVNESDRLISNIEDIAKHNDSSMISGRPMLTSATTGISLLDSIYPKRSFDDINALMKDDSQSVYPSLYQQLKYGVIAASAISGTLFKTHSPEFKQLKHFLGSKDLTTIKEFENHIISLAMNKSKMVTSNTYAVRDNKNKDNNYLIDVSAPSDYENRSRLFGFGQELVNEFDFKDLSEDNVRRFMLLTPANKVMLLQSSTKTDDLFKRLNVSIQDSRLVSAGRHSPQKINIIDIGIGYEQMYQLFKNAYNNDSPFVKLAAIDVVRYSIVVEGYKFKGGSVSKVVPTEILYGKRTKSRDGISYDSTNGVSNGSGIISDTNRALNDYLASVKHMDYRSLDSLLENFYRSYTKSKDIPKFENKRGRYPAIRFALNGATFIEESIASSKKLIKRNTNGMPEYHRYVMTNRPGSKRMELFKLSPASNGVYLYPINELEANEIGEISVNPDNRAAPESSTFKSIIEANMSADNDVYIPNLTALEKAKYNITRDFVQLSNMDENYTDYKDSKVIDLWLSTTKDVNIINSIEDLNIDRSKRSIIVARDRATTVVVISELEKSKYSNYLVIAKDDSMNDIRDKLNVLNREELKAIKESQNHLKLTSRKANLVTKGPDGKDSGSFRQFKTLIDEMSTDAINTGVTFTAVMPELVRRLSFAPATYYTINRGGVDFVVTNIGEVNKRNMPMIPEYNQSLIVTTTRGQEYGFPMREVITNAVVLGSAMSFYNRATILKIQTLEHFKNEDIRESTLEETDESINQYISEVVASVARTERNTDDKSISEVAKAFVNLDIRINNSSKFNDNLREAALKVINGYTTNRSDYMFAKMLDFHKGMGINNPKLFELMITDDTLRTEYEMFIDSLSRFIEDYSSVSNIELYDIKEAELAGATAEEILDLRRTNETLKQIKSQLTKMNSLTNRVNNSIKMFFDSVIANSSTDPRIRTKLMELTDVFDDENWAQLKLANIAETHIPIVQVVLKEVMTNLRASEINARDKRISFRTEIDAIISKAKASGYNLSLNDIVDDSGKLILPYTQQFLDDLGEHKQALSIAAIEDPNGRNGVIYREARSKLENFMINNLERQYIKDFYADYAKLDNDLLKYKDSYVKLKSLMFEQSQILSTMIDNDYSTLSVEKEKRLKEIGAVIAEMRNTVDENGNYKDNYYEAKAVDDYYVNRRLLEVKYKEVEPKESYVNKLKEVMGDLQSPENSETYIAAKKWLDSNTYKKLSDEFNSKLNKAFSSLRTSRVDSYLRDMTKGKYDEFGVVNGNLFNDIQISNIKSNQESKYKERSSDSRTRLIRNKQSDSNIYMSEFYENMRSAAQPAITRSTIDAINAILLPYYNSRSESLETSQISISDLNKLQTLYDKLADSGKSLTIDNQGNVTLTNLKGKSDFATAKFLEDEVVFDFDMAEYERQADLALETGGITYFKEWKKVNTEVVRDSVHYKTISELGTTIASLLKVSKSRRNVNIAKSIRILEFLKPNPDAINANNRILINSKKSTLGYYLDYLVGKTYRDSGIRTLNDIILSAKSTSPVKELLDDYRTRISTKEKDTTISDQLELLAKTGKLELSEDYKDQLARRDINSPDIFEDDWYINNHTLDDNGNIVPTPENFKFIANSETTKVQPNSRIYGTISPKNKEAWIDPEKTEAKEFVDSNVEFKNTQYYEAKYREMKAKGEVEFKQWYDANHYYDSFNNRYEPLSIWREMIVKDISNYKYEPKSKWLETKVRKEFNNLNYEEGKIKTSNLKYSNDAYYNMNQYTREAYDVVSNLMNELVKDKRSRNYINKGFLPSQSIESSESKGFKDYWQDFAKSHGWYDAPINQDSVSSFNQREVNAPMLHTLSKTKLIKLRERGQDESAADFANYVKETVAQNKELQKQIIEENKQLNNPNVGERLDAFIEQMYAHNSMQESARLMKITANQLKNLKFVNRDSKGKAISDKILERISGKDQITTKDVGGTSNISKHFEAQMRKLIYNEFEKDEGTKSKVSRVLRNVVSARFMMMNVTGGIANVVYGKSQIQMERAAGTHFKYRDFLKAEMEYKDGILSYFADAYKGTTNNEVNAIIRLFDVIDLQDVREKYGNKETAFNRFENALYLQQTMGEHYMQNTTLLAMLLSHRVVKDSDGKAKVMSFETYSQSMRDSVLLDTLSKYDGINGTDLSGEYKKTLDTIKSSTVNKEAYIRFKRDAVTDFLKSKGKALQTMFNENYKEVKASTKSEFETLPTFRSQLELKNGVATLIEGSELTNEDIAEFRGEVISLNHNIHGVYDRIGANTIQQHWAGALLMQFHKHLVPGFSKRFGYRLGHTDGIYSETRKEVSKGSYVSMAQFIATPFAKHYELNNDGELVAVRALQNIVTGYADFVSNFKTYYNILPEYDKANIRRVLSEWATIAKALLMYTAGRLLLDDDDESTQVADYVLYNADRLLSETIQYSPYGMLNETQKLYSNPIAALSTIKETQKALAAVASYAVTGDKEVLVYNSGTWYGQNKITTALWKQVPLYNQYMKHERLGVNNSYYKVRSGVLQGLVKDIIDKD